MNLIKIKRILCFILVLGLSGCLESVEILPVSITIPKSFTVLDGKSGQICHFSNLSNVEISLISQIPKEANHPENMGKFYFNFLDKLTNIKCTVEVGGEFLEAPFVDKDIVSEVFFPNEIGQQFSIKYFIDTKTTSEDSGCKNSLGCSIYDISIIGLDTKNSPIFNVQSKIKVNFEQ